MITFAFQPIIDFLVEYLTVWITQWLSRSPDQAGSTNTDYLTFLEMNAGPEYFFYYKAATTNLLMLGCFLLGSSIPVLYLIGAIGIAI